MEPPKSWVYGLEDAEIRTRISEFEVPSSIWIIWGCVRLSQFAAIEMTRVLSCCFFFMFFGFHVSTHVRFELGWIIGDLSPSRNDSWVQIFLSHGWFRGPTHSSGRTRANETKGARRDGDDGGGGMIP